MISKLLRISAGLALGLFLAGPALADWQQLHCLSVGRHSDEIEFKPASNNEWFDAIRLVGDTGKARVSRLKVRFHNDETQNFDIDKTLASGERTHKLQFNKPPRRLTAFELRLGDPREDGTRICIEAMPASKTGGGGGGGGGNTGGGGGNAGNGGGNWAGGDYKIEVLCRKEAEEMGFTVLSVGKVREVQARPPVKEARVSARNRGREQTLICRYDVNEDLATFYSSDRPSENEIAALRECRAGAGKLDFRVTSMGDVREVEGIRGAHEVRIKVRDRAAEKRLICRYHDPEMLATFYSPR